MLFELLALGFVYVLPKPLFSRCPGRSIRTQGLEIFGGFHKCLEKFLELIDLSYKLLSLKFYVRFATFALEATVTPYPFNRLLDLATTVGASNGHQVALNRVFSHGLS